MISVIGETPPQGPDLLVDRLPDKKTDNIKPMITTEDQSVL